ncbi:hypothetical protein [Klebsiella pneumoniae]|uniref:hypothetical protein n=1 Tax=Klebsiella pneumoniae TaxID=573 RepID=UPI003B98720D
MTERQQNRNVCAVGKASEGMTIDHKAILSGVMRKEATQVYIPHFKGACPAFVEWADQCLPGEKLPRGQYFRKRDWVRQFNTRLISFKADHPDEGKYGWLFNNADQE